MSHTNCGNERWMFYLKKIVAEIVKKNTLSRATDNYKNLKSDFNDTKKQENYLKIKQN